MLVRLFGQNFRSLKQEFELSLVAAELTNSKDSNRGVVNVTVDGLDQPLKLLRSVAIYGPNASGKSTILTAGNAIRWFVAHSSRMAEPDGRVSPYEPFILDDEAAKSQIKLGCDVIHKKKILRYCIEYNKTSIESEMLSLIDGSGTSVLLDRRGHGKIKGSLVESSEANQLYTKEMQPNVSVLSKLTQHGPSRGSESAKPYSESITNALRYRDYSSVARMGMQIGDDDSNRFADDVEYRDWIMENLIRNADVGICDVQVKREVMEYPDAFSELVSKSGGKFQLPDTQVVVSFVHTGGSQRAVDFADESAGTRKLFGLSGDWWLLGNKGGTILADELGASLHPRLLDQLVRTVNEKKGTKIRPQLIFTTHETGLLESRDGLPPALRRDQVYLVTKDKLGQTELFSLAEFKDEARPVHNIRKRYLSGLYGALPSVEGVSM